MTLTQRGASATAARQVDNLKVSMEGSHTQIESFNGGDLDLVPQLIYKMFDELYGNLATVVSTKLFKWSEVLPTCVSLRCPRGDRVWFLEHLR